MIHLYNTQHVDINGVVELPMPSAVRPYPLTLEGMEAERKARNRAVVTYPSPSATEGLIALHRNRGFPNEY